MVEELDLPDGIYGFGSWLLWVLATRATPVVDRAFEAGPARPSRHYGTVDGHPVPTPSLVAWLLTAAEAGISLDQLPRRDRRLDERQKVLRTIVSRAIGGEPRLFKDGWLRELAAICGLGDQELDLLAGCRDDEGYPVDPGALRTAIAQSFRARPAPGDGRLSTAGTAAARTLPRDIASFTGRDLEFRMLLEAVEDAKASSAGVVAIHAIGGMPGVGKTAFAVHAAHLLAERFPGGQIFLSLHGHTPGQHPVDPADALASLLMTVGVSAQRIPLGLEARMALWRDHLASRQLLLVLDDAVSHEQVTPLLPGTGGSVVLVTSRRHLAALEDARSVSLGTLSPDQAAELLLRLAARPGLAPDDPAVVQIAERCGYLPLALGMLARQLHHHPAWTPADLAADLATARDRLELMHAENLSVAAAFDLSYAELTPGQQQLFRRLGLHPGPDVDACAAAALGHTDLATGRRLLDDLYEQYLILEPAHGRYRLHDLIREHARALAGADEAADNDAATGRLLDYYQHVTDAAGNMVARHSRTRPGQAVGTAQPAVVPDLADREQALAWLRAERANLLACLDAVTRADQQAAVTALTAALAGLLRTDGPWAEAITRHTAALQAARDLGDRHGQANALNDLGDVRRLSGDYRGAAQALEEALGIYRDLGDRLGQANVLNDLGVVQWVTGDYQGAAQPLEQALGIYRDLGDRLGQANALRELGAVGLGTGDYPAAAQALEQALGIYRDLGDRRGQANSLHYLGLARWAAGDYPGAAQAHEQALGIYRDLGDRHGQANTLRDLGFARRLTGDYPGAAQALEQALGICHEFGDRLGQANVLYYLGVVWRLTGDYPAAAQAHEQALSMYRDFGDRRGQANALSDLGAVRQASGDYPAAARALEQALGIYRDIGDRGGEAEALNKKGTLHRVSGELAQAEECHQQALEMARAIASFGDEADALAGLGRCATAVGDTTQAEVLLRQALEIFQRIGAAEAPDLLAEVVALAGPPPAH